MPGTRNLGRKGAFAKARVLVEPPYVMPITCSIHVKRLRNSTKTGIYVE
jgi:hypothetical protein